MGLGLVPNLKYGLILANPKEFYHEIHRPSHFIKFNRLDEDEEEKDVVDVDNLFV